MIIYKASKFRVYPNKSQQHIINSTLGSCRYIYNKMLERQKLIYKRRGEHLSYNEMQNLLPGMKQYLPWLKEADSQALKYACRQLDTAYQRFFKGDGGFPTYKKRKKAQSYTTTNAKSIHISDERKQIKLPIVGWIKTRGLNIPADATITKATVTRDTDGKYYASVAYKTNSTNVYIFPKVDSVKAIGLDFREADLYCDSNGISAGKPTNIMTDILKLKKLQGRLSVMIESHITGYRVVGDKRFPIYQRPLSEYGNIQKIRKRIAKHHKHIANKRKDFLQKQSTAIVKQYDVICTEDFCVKDMLLDKAEDPSAIKRHNINRRVYDDGWYMFTQMLEYKAEWLGKRFIRVGREFPSTQICSCCGYVESKLKDVSIRKWECPQCKAEHYRDHNAAINIRDEGLRLLASV